MKKIAVKNNCSENVKNYIKNNNKNKVHRIIGKRYKRDIYTQRENE